MLKKKKKKKRCVADLKCRYTLSEMHFCDEHQVDCNIAPVANGRPFISDGITSNRKHVCLLLLFHPSPVAH